VNEAERPTTDRDAPNDAGGDDAPTGGATASLAREVYWAGGRASERGTDLASLRERLDAFSRRMRLDQHQPVPSNESTLGSTVAWKHRTKVLLWRVSRFATMRYDRLLADLAEMNAELAQRLLETEEELARLRNELHGSSGDGG
jgi:hypothetical protein